MSDLLTKTTPSTNGVVKIARRGRAKFQFGDDDQPFEVDVLAVYDQWYVVNWQLRDIDEKGDGVVPNDKQDEFGQNRLNFAQAVVNSAYESQQLGAAPVLCRAEAEAFIDEISKKAAELRNFTVSKKDTPSSQPDSTGESARINFSQ